MAAPDLFGGVAAVIFDCDGVLCDTEPLSQRAWEAALAGHGLAITAAEFAAVVGGTERDVAVRFADQAGVAPEVLEDLARGELLDLMADGVPVFPDAVALLDRLLAEGLPVAVASNSFRWRLKAVLAAAGLEPRIAVSVAGDEVPAPKPAPDVYLEAARRLGVDPQRCLVFEDSPTGIRSAVKAGTRVVAVDRGMFDRAKLAEAELVLSSLDGLSRQLGIQG